MDFDSVNLLGEIEDFLENAPPLSSRCSPGNPSAAVSPHYFPTKSTMTAATKAALGEHLRNHLGAAEKRKLDEHGIDSSSLPKAQKLEEEEDLAYLLDSSSATATGRDKVDVFGEEHQQHSQIERKSQGILAQVLMDKKGIRSQNNVDSMSLEMANRNRVDADGYSNSPEDILVMRKINEIVKNPGLDNQRRSAEVTKIMHENPNARRLLARLKSKKGTKNMTLVNENGSIEESSRGIMTDMNGQQQFGGFNASANELLDSSNHLTNEGDNNQQWVYGQQQQGKIIQPSHAQRSNYMGQQYPIANKQMCSMEAGGMFPSNGSNSIDTNGSMWNHESQFVNPRGMMQQQQHGPPPYPYGVGTTGGGGVIMRNPGMELHLSHQMSHNGPMNYPISHQNEFVVNSQNVSLRAPTLVQRRIHPGMNEYHHHGMNPGFGGHVMQNGMMVQQSMKMANFNEGGGGIFNGDCLPTRGMLVNPGMSSPVRHPRAAAGGMGMNAITKVGSPHMSPHMQTPQINGYQGMVNEFPYQQQQQQQQQEHQHFQYGGFPEGNLQRMNGGGMTTSASNDLGFGSNQLSDAFGVTGRMQQNQFFKEFEEETKKVMQENGDYRPNESAVSWRLSPDSQFYHNDLRRRLKDAVAALDNPALVAEAMKFEEDAFNNCDNREAYSAHIVQWLAGVYQRSEVKAAATSEQLPPPPPPANLPDINVQDMGPSSCLTTADSTRDNADVAEEYIESVKSSVNSPSPKPFLSEHNPILSKLLPAISQQGSNDPLSSASSSVDSAVSTSSPPPPSSLSSAVSSSAASANNSSKSSLGEDHFQSPNAFPAPNSFDETKSPPSISTLSTTVVSHNANGLQRGARRTSGKNQVNNPYSVDSGFGSPRSNTSSSLCSPKIQGTSPILLPISESSPEK